MCMQPEIIKRKNTNQNFIYKNSKIKICISCGFDKIDSYEFGVSCEECGASFGRLTC